MSARLGIRSGWLALMIGLLALGTLAAAELRQWSDATGKFKIKGKFVSLENGTVILEKEDGEEIEIELKKLSTADQKVANDLAKAKDDAPFKTKTKTKDDPFKSKMKPAQSGKPGRPGAPKTTAEPVDAGDTPVIKVDWSKADVITLAPPTDGWTVEVPKAELPDPGSKSKPITLPQKANFFEGMKGLVISRDLKRAVIGYNMGNPQQGGTTRLLGIDLATGKAGGSVSASVQMVPLAIHDDSDQILMRRDEFGFGNLDRLEVWSMKSGKIEKLWICTPYEEVSGGPRDVMWAEFLDTEHLATASRGGKVAIWKYPEMEPICWFQSADSKPALSPDRKLIAYCTGDDVGLFDVEKRQVVAQQSTPMKLQWPQLAFSPSGKRLGCIAFDKVLMWDVASGKLEQSFAPTGIMIKDSIEFPDDNYLLGNGKFLIDMANQLKFWQYEGADQIRCINGTAFIAVSAGNNAPGALLTMQLPHAGAKDLLKKALTDPTLFVLRAGTTVKLDLNGIADATQRATVEQALTKRLATIDCKPGPAGTIDLVASVEGPKDRELQYHAAGTYKTKEFFTKVKFVYQGQPAWESSGSNISFIISLKRGDNIENHLREREKPDYTFFDRVELPKFLQKPTAGQGPGRSVTLGQSTITTAGLK